MPAIGRSTCKTRLAVFLTVALTFGPGCSSSSESGNKPKWCRLTIENTAAPSALSDAELDEWMTAAPPDIRNETDSFVGVARELRELLAEAPSGNQQQIADQALARLLSDPEVQTDGAILQQYLFENCPDFANN